MTLSVCKYSVMWTHTHTWYAFFYRFCFCFVFEISFFFSLYILHSNFCWSYSFFFFHWPVHIIFLSAFLCTFSAAATICECIFIIFLHDPSRCVKRWWWFFFSLIFSFSFHFRLYLEKSFDNIHLLCNKMCE